MTSDDLTSFNQNAECEELDNTEKTKQQMEAEAQLKDKLNSLQIEEFPIDKYFFLIQERITAIQGSMDLAFDIDELHALYLITVILKHMQKSIEHHKHTCQGLNSEVLESHDNKDKAIQTSRKLKDKICQTSSEPEKDKKNGKEIIMRVFHFSAILAIFKIYVTLLHFTYTNDSTHFYAIYIIS